MRLIPSLILAALACLTFAADAEAGRRVRVRQRVVVRQRAAVVVAQPVAVRAVAVKAVRVKAVRAPAVRASVRVRVR